MTKKPVYFKKNNFRVSERSILDYFRKSTQDLQTINRLACLICDAPISHINMLDEEFQYTISKNEDWNEKIGPVKKTVCQFTNENEDIFIVNDTQTDEKVSEIKDYVKDKSIRFYAGVPFRSLKSGKVLGSLCIYDFKPKELVQDQIQALKDLSNNINNCIDLFVEKEKMESRNELLNEASAFLKNSTDVLWVVDPVNLKIINSSGADSIFRRANDEIEGKYLTEFINQDQLQNHLQNWINKNYKDEKIFIPIRVDFDGEDPKWLRLTFSKYEDKLLVTGRDITKKHLAEKDLKESLEEKEILLSEIHHRVKNNLAVVLSLLSLERIRTDNDAMQQILLNSESRILTITKIHELLYQTKNFSNVDLNTYLDRLIKNLAETFNTDHRNIQISKRISNINMDVSQALPMGLIFNELITNSIKHAFNDEEGGKIEIVITKNEDNKIVCKVSDDGIGLDSDSNDLTENDKNLGITLINTLCKQIDAEYDIKSESGTSFTFYFKMDNETGNTSFLQE